MSQPDKAEKCACGNDAIGIKDAAPVCQMCKDNELAHKFGQCLCSNDAFKIKNGLGVCRRCFSIEKKMYGRRQLTSGGMTKFPNPRAYELCESNEIYGT